MPCNMHKAQPSFVTLKTAIALHSATVDTNTACLAIDCVSPYGLNGFTLLCHGSPGTLQLCMLQQLFHKALGPVALYLVQAV